MRNGYVLARTGFVHLSGTRHGHTALHANARQANTHTHARQGCVSTTAKVAPGAEEQQRPRKASVLSPTGSSALEEPEGLGRKAKQHVE